jgi:hypothetical protein
VKEKVWGGVNVASEPPRPYVQRGFVEFSPDNGNDQRMGIATLVFLQFIAGFAATLIFHQPVIGILHRAGISPRPAYAMKGVPPFGVPSVISLAFWGGLWGMVMLHLLHSLHEQGAIYWIAALLFGAIFPTLVAVLVVVPLKKIVVANRGQLFAVGLLVNGAWGIGTALLYRVLTRFL